jgi:murein DD-endopeptidase MepM/ murein hydrolase activator NlpD
MDLVAGLGSRTAIAADKPASADKEQMRARLTQLAAEFEAMLLLQMLKEMRKSSSWGDEDEASTAGYGKQTMFETIDVELASRLTKTQGFGLAKQLLRALDPGAALSAEANLSTGKVGGSALQPTIAEPARDVEPVRHVDAGESSAIQMPDGHVTSAFGWRRDPIDGAARVHRGIDIRAAYGQEIQAAGAGRVVSAGTEGGYGETVVIEHAGGLRTRYAHLSASLVTPGQEVTAGQVVGRAGRSGRATGTHLHFEVTTATGDRVDPAVFARFKAEGVVADLTGGISPAAPSEQRPFDKLRAVLSRVEGRRGRLSEETR